ncbi:MAG: hypothetical protein Q8L12_02540 [Methylibium sp.]|nr:hypothetical protein [Methylibium sp.]
MVLRASARRPTDDSRLAAYAGIDRVVAPSKAGEHHDLFSPFFTLVRGPRIVHAEQLMDIPVNAGRSWSTSSFGTAADTSPMELSVLAEHLDVCKDSRGRLFLVQSVAETINGFLSARFVTTLAAFALLIAAGLLLL